MRTRKDYMDGKCSHKEYYEEIAEECGISYDNAPNLDYIKTSLKEDEHLNNIPLLRWDMAASCTKTAIARALKSRGDFYSDADGVCVHKAAAKRSAQGR